LFSIPINGEQSILIQNLLLDFRVNPRDNPKYAVSFDKRRIPINPVAERHHFLK
jgi:hypothetical protein